MGDKIQRGYMDQTDYDWHLGEAWPGPRVYASVNGLREHKEKCIDECGMVEVEVRFVRTLTKKDEAKCMAAEEKSYQEKEPARERRRQRLIAENRKQIL